MAPRGRRKKAGLMREDAARDAMRDYGFEECVINASIKELVELYGEGGWFLIEDGSYVVLLNACLEKAARQEAAQKEQAEAVQEGEEEEEKEQEDQQQVEDGRDQVGSNSTFLVGSVVGETMETPHTCQTDALSITNEVAVMDSSSPAAIQSADDYATHPVEGAKNSHCGWLSSEEEEKTEDGDDDDDDDDGTMIELTPEPLCDELEDLLREVRGQRKRKRVSRWDC